MEKISRRDFLRGGAAMAACFAATGLSALPEVYQPSASKCRLPSSQSRRMRPSGPIQLSRQPTRRLPSGRRLAGVLSVQISLPVSVLNSWGMQASIISQYPSSSG